MSKTYVWTGTARMVSKKRGEGYFLFNYDGHKPITQFTVLAPTREDAKQAINDLLGTTEVAEWQCHFESVREIYQEAQVIHHE